MATINDILDWLNQGAQGDIPGTGPQGAASAAADQAQAADNTRGFPAPSSVDETQQGAYASQAADKGIISGLTTPGAFSTTVTPQAEQKPQTITVDPDTMSNLSFTGLGNLLDQYHGIVGGTTPGNYAGDVPPKYLNYYNYLIQGGLPPDVAHQIITQPSYGEEQGQVPYRGEWPYAYAGHDQELSGAVSGQEPRDQGLADQVWQSIQNQIYGGWQQGA